MYMHRLDKAGEKDREFLFRVYASTRIDEFAALGLPSGQLEGLLHMQFEAQQRSYAASYPNALHDLIGVGDDRAGHLITAELEEVLVLVCVAILPEYRNQGIGTRVIEKLQWTAHSQGKRVRLHVVSTNNARRLYERMGFRETGFFAPYAVMEWNP